MTQKKFHAVNFCIWLDQVFSTTWVIRIYANCGSCHVWSGLSIYYYFSQRWMKSIKLVFCTGGRRNSRLFTLWLCVAVIKICIISWVSKQTMIVREGELVIKLKFNLIFRVIKLINFHWMMVISPTRDNRSFKWLHNFFFMSSSLT